MDKETVIWFNANEIRPSENDIMPNLCHTKNGSFYVARYNIELQNWFDEFGIVKDVTHWMQIPIPNYKKEV